MNIQPGDTVDFTLTFSGVVTRVATRRIVVRTKTGLHALYPEQVIRVHDPKPPEDEVINTVRCEACGRWAGTHCIHKQTRKPIKHPHKERIETFIKVTGWRSG